MVIAWLFVVVLMVTGLRWEAEADSCMSLQGIHAKVVDSVSFGDE